MGAPPIPNTLDDSELCPNCGEFTATLTENGWCIRCDPPIPKNTYQKVEAYLKANADEIEHYIIHGSTLWGAIDKLSANRPRCVVCGEPFHRARRSSVFCRGTAACRRFSRRYVYLYSERGLSKPEALAKILNEIT